MALLDIRNLSVELQHEGRTVRVIDNVTLTINEGEFLGLIGESGSGKSIIIQVICNAIKNSWHISADRFRFNNIEMLKVSSAKRRRIIARDIGIILQDPLNNLNPSQTIGAQIKDSIKHRSYKGKWWHWFGWKNRRATELFHRVGIKNHKEIMASYPSEISQGDAQKIMVAMAIASKPRLLIADEPTYALGPATQRQIYRLLAAVNKNQNTSIILTSNEINKIKEWCDRFSILYCGQTAEIGPKEDILENPCHPYTVALLYSSPDFSQSLEAKSHLNTLPGAIPLLSELPIGCRLGPRCSFSQRCCTTRPIMRRIKQHQFVCHFPLNISDSRAQHEERISSPLTIQSTDSELGDNL